jgi:cytidylate kinase
MWAIQAVHHPGFWLDAFPSKKSAMQLCKTMGWVIAGVYETIRTQQHTPCKPFLIGISGPKEHGKSTLARALAHTLSSRFASSICWEFADPMIEMAKILTQDNDFSKHKTYEIILGKPLTGTQVLQMLGTEAIRKTFGMETWTHYLRRLVSSGALKSYAWVIVPGVRMPEECDMMDYNIWLEAPGVVSSQNVYHETESHHRMLKERANLCVQRHGEQYSVDLKAITDDIVKARTLRDQLEKHEQENS